ncbi:hypothetical protein GMMP15_1600013 [Candidatus Magnetomoraceae bacterium gMMP-15]
MLNSTQKLLIAEFQNTGHEGWEFVFFAKTSNSINLPKIKEKKFRSQNHIKCAGSGGLH